EPATLQVRIAPYDFTLAQDLIERFNRQLGLLTPAQVSAGLVNLLGHLGGTRLRPTGAIYWLADDKLPVWQGAAAAVETSGVGRPNAVYLIRHEMDAGAVRAVRDAIVQDVSSRAARLQEEVLKGELGERALLAREREAQELRDKIKLYENLL